MFKNLSVVSAGSPCETFTDRILIATVQHFSVFSSSLYFRFLSNNEYRKVAFVFPFLVLKKIRVELAFNHSFISIAFVIMWGENNEDFYWIESLRKNHKHFPYNEKIVMPSTSFLKIINSTRCKRLCNRFSKCIFNFIIFSIDCRKYSGNYFGFIFSCTTG